MLCIRESIQSRLGNYLFIFTVVVDFMPLREVCPAFRKIPIAAQTIRKSPQRDNTEVKKKKKKKKKQAGNF